MLVLLVTGCAGATPPPATAEPTALVVEQRLRLVNHSEVAITRLVVLFPDQRMDFGSLPAGATSAYIPAPGGVYRYAAYEAEINGKTYQQPVIDWVGETPMAGQDFTYRLVVDPGKWETQGWVIQLSQVRQDR